MNDEQIAKFLRSELEAVRTSKLSSNTDDRIMSVSLATQIFERMAEVFIGHTQITEDEEIRYPRILGG